MATDFMRRLHESAEMLRLRNGFQGCGCSLCQAFYKKINLAPFGSRVKEFAGIISITAGRQGADIPDVSSYYWIGDLINVVDGACWTNWIVDGDFHLVYLGREDAVKAALAGGPMPDNIGIQQKVVLGEVINISNGGNSNNGEQQPSTVSTNLRAPKSFGRIRQRVRLMHSARSKPANVKPVAVAKKLSFCSLRPQ